MTNSKKTSGISPKFFIPEDLGHRDWGKEILVLHIPGICIGKILYRKAGSKGGLQYHQKKNEAHYLYSGQMIVEYDAGDGKITKTVVNAGQSWHVPPGAVHQETAITDCVIFEISTPHFNDRVRVEELYGEKAEGGLPTTAADEIVEI